MTINQPIVEPTINQQHETEELSFYCNQYLYDQYSDECLGETSQADEISSLKKLFFL